MNGIIFEDMIKKKRKLYECMWGSENFDFPVEKTKVGNFVSNNSYTFTNASAVDEELCQNRLEELFEIKNPDVFKKKFRQSCSGSGQELKRIATIHSSALCALLFFYNVTEENPYIMEIEGETYIFTYSCFEYQNTVIEGRNPSNMDVVLLGKRKQSGEIVVLFLESKFSEYYERPGKRLDISAEYLTNRYGKEIYREEYFAEMGIHIVRHLGEENFSLVSKECCYIEGIKQMISHYVGIRNLCDNPNIKNDRIAKAVDAGAQVFLGEILFTKGIGRLMIRDGEECFTSYKNKYQILAKVLNEQLKQDNINYKIIVLPDILTYSQFRNKKYIQEPKIKNFYFEFGKESD